MISNNNKAVITRIAKKTFKSNRNRNIIAIIAIVLTTILFTTVFTMGFGLMEIIQEETIKSAGGDGHVVLSLLTEEEFDKIKDNELIDEIAYSKKVDDEILNEELQENKTEMYYIDETGLEFARYHLVEGRMPEKENEIILGSRTLEAMGEKGRIGETITLSYRVKEEIKEKEFVVVGYWETDEVLGLDRIIVSEEYIKKHEEELQYTHIVGGSYAGSVAATIKFKKESSFFEQMDQLVIEAGYIGVHSAIDKREDNHMIARVSPAYQSISVSNDYTMVLAILGVILLIGITGYLIIYNIFQISVIQDIKYFGLLKTLGTTKKQIKKIMNKQIHILAFVGIPIGILLGYLIGNLLVPLLLEQTLYGRGSKIGISLNPMIIIGATLFTYITIYISVRKPGNIAANVSPLEALRYSDKSGSKRRKNQKKTLKGGKLHKMAMANLGRNKRRTLLVILSLSIGTVLLNTVVILAQGFNEEVFVERFVDKDFIIATADYFDYQFERAETVLSNDYIEFVEAQPEFQTGGKLVAMKMLKENFYADSTALYSVNKNLNGYPMVEMYGVDDYLMNEMQILEGSIDYEKLNSGQGIVLGEIDDGTGQSEGSTSISVGDIIPFHYEEDGEGGKRRVINLEVVAKVLVNGNSYTTRSTGITNFYLPSDIFVDLVQYPEVAAYSFDCKDGSENIISMEEKLENYIEIDSTMEYESKKTYIEVFNNLIQSITIIGSSMGFIIAFIGIVNFINAMITSVVIRKREFAMMQSIGMTDIQLRNMLCMEGLGYAVGTIVVSVVLSIFISYTVVQMILDSIWFFTYQFTLMPVIIISPILILMALLVPYLLSNTINKNNIIERIKGE